MAVYNFEGDIANISESQLEFINNVILEHGLKDNKIFFESVGKPGDNYVASVKRITIEGANGSIKIIAKIAPTLEIIRKPMNTRVLFENEHLMYTEVLPKLIQFQKNAGIPEEEQLRYAKCYGSTLEEPNEVILLEDMTASDFIMLDRFTSLSNDCVKSMMKNFAVLHSLSFVLKHKEPETYNKFKNNLTNLWTLVGGSDDAMGFFQMIEDDTIAIVKDPKYQDFVRHKVSDLPNLATKFSKIDAYNQYTVILQGDSWTNNILFKFQGEKLIDSVMIDYQLSRNTSPVNDIMYMIFNCTDHETRKENFYDWIEYYHSELEKSLFNYNLKTSLVYPRDKLDVDLKQYAKFSFGLSVLLASMLIRKTEDVAKMTDAMKNENKPDAQDFVVSTLDEESTTRYRNRIIGLIESFTELGLM
ncbi:unnamed protein product [Arctia plantaginis]|uniref:CHK kinase-like domain-containing protein n=1 Tax=Arctia plantaginis TaxID=874455 RepID=A0A8S0Z035_ARCPL|nr:unnamed protein product [Arctia plantaginis]